MITFRQYVTSALVAGSVRRHHVASLKRGVGKQMYGIDACIAGRVFRHEWRRTQVVVSNKIPDYVWPRRQWD